MAPTKDQITKLFNNLSSPETSKQFFESVEDKVDWWIVGHTKMSGQYNSKQDFLDATLAILNGKMLDGPLTFRLLNVVGGGADDEWATVEMEAIDAKCRDGMPYPMRYCWNVRFGGNGMIQQVRAYIDTQLLAEAMEQNA